MAPQSMQHIRTEVEFLAYTSKEWLVQSRAVHHGPDNTMESLTEIDEEIAERPLPTLASEKEGGLFFLV